MYIKYMTDQGAWVVESDVKSVRWNYKYMTEPQIDSLYATSARVEIPDLSSLDEHTEPPANGHRILCLEWESPVRHAEGDECLLTAYHAFLLNDSGKTIENLSP